MYILIIVLTFGGGYNTGGGMTSQQISFNTLQGCATAAKGLEGKRYVSQLFCVQTDKK